MESEHFWSLPAASGEPHEQSIVFAVVVLAGSGVWPRHLAVLDRAAGGDASRRFLGISRSRSDALGSDVLVVFGLKCVQRRIVHFGQPTTGPPPPAFAAPHGAAELQLWRSELRPLSIGRARTNRMACACGWHECGTRLRADGHGWWLVPPRGFGGVRSAVALAFGRLGNIGPRVAVASGGLGPRSNGHRQVARRFVP